MTKRKDIDDLKKVYLSIPDNSVEEWKEESLKVLREIYDNFNTRAMNPSCSSKLYGQKLMLEAVMNFIRDN